VDEENATARNRGQDEEIAERGSWKDIPIEEKGRVCSEDEL